MTDRTYFQNPNRPAQWHVTTDPAERRRLRHRGWQRRTIKAIDPATYAKLKPLTPGTYLISLGSSEIIPMLNAASPTASRWSWMGV